MNKQYKQNLKNILARITKSYSLMKKSMLFGLAAFLVIAGHNFFFSIEGGKVIATEPVHQQIIAANFQPVALEQSCDTKALQNGTLKCQAKATVEVLGTNYACDRHANWLVKTKIHLGSQNLILSEGQRQNIQMNKKDIPQIAAIPVASGASCISSGNTISNNYRYLRDGRVVLLTNGSDIPDSLTSEAHHSTASYLQKYLHGGKIKLASNEAIYLFELGQQNPNHPNFDLQDSAVKISLYQPA